MVEFVEDNRQSYGVEPNGSGSRIPVRREPVYEKLQTLAAGDSGTEIDCSRPAEYVSVI